jgi:hypothetical protein
MLICNTVTKMRQFNLLELVGAIAFTALLTMGIMGAWFIVIYN